VVEFKKAARLETGFEEVVPTATTNAPVPRQLSQSGAATVDSCAETMTHCSCAG